VLSDGVIAAVAEVLQEAEDALLQPVREGRVSQEPDMTSRLAQSIEIISRTVDDVTIELHVVDSLGPNAAERDLGADIVGVVRIEVGELRLSKGFLAQSKRSGTQGVSFKKADATNHHYSHWLYRGPLELEHSGTVSVSRPSSDLEEQCDNMLRVTPAAFVFVYDENQVAVVGASAVRALRNRPTKTRARIPVGTKRLDDFYINLVDCFIGDPKLTAADREAVKALAASNRARTGMLLRITSVDDRK
jgi:hypothetical protein